MNYRIFALSPHLRTVPIFLFLPGTLFLTTGCPFPLSNQTHTPAVPTTIPMIANTASVTELEQLVHQKINQHRASKNLPPLRLDPDIATQSRLHSQNMANGKVEFSHHGFQDRTNALKNRINLSGIAENVGYNMGYREPASQVVQGWLDSPGHRQNLEGNYDLTGIGVAKNAKGEYYFTQMFVRRR